jgi:hypothetical protein
VSGRIPEPKFAFLGVKPGTSGDALSAAPRFTA